MVGRADDQCGRTDVVGLAPLIDVPAPSHKQALYQKGIIPRFAAARRFDRTGCESWKFQTIDLTDLKRAPRCDDLPVLH